MSGRGVGPWRAPGPRLRLRAVLADRLPAVVAACLLLAAVGGAASYGALVAPGTTTETGTVGAWETDGHFKHAATVRESNPVYPVGSTLSNRSAYFARVTPVLEGAFAAGYAAAAGEVDARTTLTLVLRAGADGETYWRVTERIDRRSATLAPGERLTVPFRLNVSAIRDRLRRIESSLGSAGETVVRVRARTRYRGTVEGRGVNLTTTRTLTLHPEGQLYRVSNDGPAATTHRWTETTEVPVRAGPLRALGGPFLLLLGLLGVVGAVGARRRGLLDLTERERARLERAAFDEWVTVARVPESLPGERVRVASLEGLVDLAADTDARILQDEVWGHYVVLDDDVHYWYEPVERDAEE